MKIGINLVGIASDPEGTDRMGYYGKSKERDWEIAKDYIKTKVINCWGDAQIETYLYSYINYDTDKIIDWYKPKKSTFIEFEGSHQQITFLKSLEQLVGEDLDFIVSTRFDINFKQPLNLYDIDFNKSNFLFMESDGWWDSHKFTCDNLYMFPKSHLESWIQGVKNLHANPPRPNPDLHGLYKFVSEIIGEDNTNFLIKDGNYRSSNSPIPWEHPFNKEYRLLRKPDPNHEPHDSAIDWKSKL